MSYMSEKSDLAFGAPLEIEDLDLAGMLGYTVSKGKTEYFILEREMINEEYTGYYKKKKISKATYEEIRDAKTERTSMERDR